MRLLAILTVAALLVPFAVRAAEDDVKTKVKDFQEAMKAKEASARKSAVEGIATVKDPAVADALVRFLGDRDPEVRGAVGFALGQQGDEKHRGKILSRVTDKEDPQAIVGYCAGLELLPDVKSVDPLMKYIKKVIYAQKEEEKDAAVAATKALAKIRHKSAVDALIELLGLTNPRAGASTGAVSDETRKFRGAFKVPVLEGLSYITGQHFKDPAVWEGWWKDVEKRFKVPTGEESLDASDTYEDYGYKFVLKKPNASWSFSRPTGDNYIIELGHPQEGNEGTNDASVTVEAFNQADFADSTPGARVEYWADWAKNTGFKDIKETEVKDVSFCGEKAKLWMVKGLTAAGTVWTHENYIFAKDGLLWTVHVKSLSGIPETLTKDLEKALRSFAFLK